MSSHQGLATGGMSGHSGLPDKGVCVVTHSKTEREFWKPDNVSSIGTCCFLAQISVFLTIKWGHLPCNGCK